MARDLAEELARSDPGDRDRILHRCREMEDPLEVFRPLSNPDRIADLAGKQADGYILMETDAVTFFPSMGSGTPGALDYAVAMNRRYFIRGLWFSIISLNCEYLKRAPDGIIAYALEHEFEMGRLYQEAFGEMRKLSPGEKLQISQAAHQTSIDKTRVSLADLIDEEMLMLQLSGSQPPIPKPYAETALLAYLEDNISKLEVFGSKSRDEGEDAFGAELYAEFEGWSLFSRESYRLFVREVDQGVRESYRGYV
ncbi:MAG: hypothetical protein WBK88_10185 [Methanothrix sp.]